MSGDIYGSNPLGNLVNFVTVHWYKGADVNEFKLDIQALHHKFGKPAWVVEFAPQFSSSAKLSPNKYSQSSSLHS